MFLKLLIADLLLCPASIQKASVLYNDSNQNQPIASTYIYIYIKVLYDTNKVYSACVYMHSKQQMKLNCSLYSLRPSLSMILFAISFSPITSPPIILTNNDQYARPDCVHSTSIAF